MHVSERLVDQVQVQVIELEAGGERVGLDELEVGERFLDAILQEEVLHEGDAIGFVECGYCDRRFVLIGGQSDDQAA